MPARLLLTFTLAILTLFGLATRATGLGRSLWTDEVWVANSVVSNSLQQLFYPESWLQTTAPLFLLLVRATSLLFGPGEVALRLIPSLMGILAALSFLLLAHRLLHRGPALLASTLFLFTPLAIVFSRLLKQYSAELAAAVFILLATQIYLNSRSHKAFFLLLGLTLTGLTLGYGLAFMLPAILLALILPLLGAQASIEVKQRALLHTTLLALFSAATLLAEYYYFVLPNSSESLSLFWQLESSTESFPRFFLNRFYELFQRSLPFLPPRLAVTNPKHLLLLAALAILLGSGLAASFRRKSKALPFRLIAYSTILLLILAGRLSLYPAIDRTSLFTLPLTVFLLADGFQSFWLFVIHKNRLIASATCLLLSITLGLSFHNPPAGIGEPSFEDYRSAVQYLKTHAGPADILWVHGAASEAFRYYSGILNWKADQTYIADTGWPCCARNRDTVSGGSPQLFLSGLELKLPFPYHGRLWTLYTNRQTHYSFLGFDERPVIRQFLDTKGCRESGRQSFPQVGIAAWNCP